MKINHLILGVVSFIMVSCGNVSNITYFQDLQNEESVSSIEPVKITIKPADLISIVVFTQDHDLTNMFNLPYVTARLGMSSSSYNSSYPQGMLGYLVDENGYVDFPVLGPLKLAGLTRAQAADFVKKSLQDNNLVKDPVVNVDYMNLMVSVLGEVARPGRYPIDKDEITILEALSKAGDLTIFGLRDQITVLRTENGEQKSYIVNLCDAGSLASSPVYYLQQNDLIYVAPNKMRARQSTVNGNNILSASFWISFASLAASILNMIL